MTKTKAKSIICYALLIIVLLWLILSTVDMWNGGKGKWGFWYLCGNHATETECVVTACTEYNGDSYYTVTVEDRNGNQWCYYDSEEQPVGTVLRVTWNGNNEITDVSH